MVENPKSILLVGESDVGKTHYGAQLLRRLNASSGLLRMKDAGERADTYSEQ